MMTSKQETERRAILTTAHHDFEKGLNLRAFFKMHDHAAGEDLVQDTFLKTWKYLVKGGKIDVMKSFLYHILNNLIIDEYRKKKNQTASLDAMTDEGFEPSADSVSGLTASERLMNALDGKTALLLIQRLPETYRKVMRMKYVQDLSIKEMSLITGQTKNAIAVQMHRGLEKLKLLYSPI